MKFYAKFFLLFILCALFCFVEGGFGLSCAGSVAQEPIYLVPSGEVVGIKLYSTGVLVVDVEKNAESSGVMKNDIIKKVNGKSVQTVEAFLEEMAACSGESMELLCSRDRESFLVSVKPVYVEEQKKYRLGIWIRDSSAGVGTLTYYNPKTHEFGALGHSINDEDTKKLLVSDYGECVEATVFGIQKSVKGSPGQIKAFFKNEDKPIAKINVNSDAGISGSLIKESIGEPLPVAKFSEIMLGKAQILCTVDDNPPKYYDAAIVKISKGLGENKKSLVVKVTDEELISKTGGIVQGMSGSPIIQNNRFVGAVTHVFVNDPQKGYGILIEDMLSETKK